MNKIYIFGLTIFLSLFLTSTAHAASFRIGGPLKFAPVDTGVTIRNYSGQPVMVVIGSYVDLKSCWESDNKRGIPDGIYVPKSRYGFSGGFYKCGIRKIFRNTRSTSKSVFLKHGETFIEKEATGDRAGGEMMVFATTVKPGKHGGAGLTWHDGVTKHDNPKGGSKVSLCVREAFPKWDGRRNQYTPSNITGLRGYHPDYCNVPIPSYIYRNTDQYMHELVLTPENANRETYTPVNIRSLN